MILDDVQPATIAAHVDGIAGDSVLLRVLHALGVNFGDAAVVSKLVNGRESPAGTAGTLVADGGRTTALGALSFPIPLSGRVANVLGLHGRGMLSNRAEQGADVMLRGSFEAFGNRSLPCHPGRALELVEELLVVKQI